jgi:predicted DNA binding CopG/RHH family protein
MPKADQRMTTVRSWEEVPSFESEAEESAFWATHDLSDELLARMKPDADPELPPPRPRTRPIAIRFDESTLRRVKALAARRGKGYQTLLKEFVSERLYEEEKREGLVGR